jgi:hypothetical protein
MNDLHVYCSEDIDWVVAENEDEANRILLDLHGGSKSNNVKQEPDDNEFTVQLEKVKVGEHNVSIGAKPDNNWTTITKTFGQWAKDHGKGFLCATEF